jgi:hypothetical protein
VTIATSQSSAVGHGNGATTSFNYGFLIPDESTLVVIYTDAAGVQTILSPTQFSVTGLDDPNGGAVTYPLAGPAIAVGTSLTIQRAIPYTQPTRLANQAGYFPQAVEGALDWLEMQIQQAVASINTGIHYPAVDVNPVSELVPAAARAGKFFAFDGNGNPAMLPGNLLSGDLSAYTIFGATFNNTHLAANNAIDFDKGWYIVYNTNAATDQYGMAIDIEGTGGAGLSVNALLNAANQNFSNRGLYPLVTQAWNKPGGGGTLVAAEFAAINETNNFTGSKWGCDIVWKDRGDGVATVVQGLGANEYNLGAFGLVFDSQSRSTAGERCGWRRGIYFTPDALDADANGAAIGIDFAKVRFYGGTNPLTAYRMTAAIRMNAYQTILWNGDPTLPNDPTEPVNPIRTYFASALAPNGRWVITNTAAEIFGVDVVTGAIYINGAASSLVTLAGNNVFTGNNTFNTGTFTVSTSPNFTGLGKRLIANFSDATLANRFSLQTSVVNGTTEAQIIPNGAGATAALSVISDSAVANGTYLRLAATSGNVAIGSGHLGGGVTGPILITIDAAEVARFGWNGTDFQLLINTTATSSVVGTHLRVNGIVVIDNTCSIVAHKNGVDQAGIANTTFTLITFGTKDFDQDNDFNTGTSTWTPKAGKYLVSVSLDWATIDTARYVLLLYKNGAAHRDGQQCPGVTGQFCNVNMTCVVDANGTDTFQVYGWQNSGGAAVISGTTFDTWFSAHRIG